MSCDDHSFHTKRFGNTKTCIWLRAASYDWMNSTHIQAWSQVQVLSNVYFSILMTNVTLLVLHLNIS